MKKNQKFYFSCLGLIWLFISCGGEKQTVQTDEAQAVDTVYAVTAANGPLIQQPAL